MRRIVVAVVAVLALGAATLPASADTPGCVTRWEFRKVVKGMARSRVHYICDTTGKQYLVFNGYESREYKGCGSAYSVVMIDYDEHRRVTSKAAIWI